MRLRELGRDMRSLIPMPDKKKFVTRNELYEKIWAKPMVQVANEFGISGVALAKICKKLNVRTAYLGHCTAAAALQLGRHESCRSRPAR